MYRNDDIARGTKYTGRELWAFVNRADTPEKIAIAEKWITKHVDDVDLWDDLMTALSMNSREYYRDPYDRWEVPQSRDDWDTDEDYYEF